jgi:hypothetical protein
MDHSKSAKRAAQFPSWNFFLAVIVMQPSASMFLRSETHRKDFAMLRHTQLSLQDALPPSSHSSAPSLDMRLERSTDFPQDVILPEQFFSPLSALKHGVNALLSAILTDAVTCFKKHSNATTQRGRRLSQETEEWFFRDEPEWPFSFISICDALNLDPDYIRRGLQQWRSTPARSPAKRTRRVTRVGRRLKVTV